MSLQTISAIVLAYHNCRLIEMSLVDEINALIAKVDAEPKSAMLAERDDVLAKMKADKNLSNWTTFNR